MLKAANRARHVEARAAGANVIAPASAPAVGASEAVNALSKFSAKVVAITDGDTVDVLAPGGLTYAIRLAGIDAPEHDQVFGSQSTANLTALVSGKSVTLECENERSYGRLICKILLPNYIIQQPVGRYIDLASQISKLLIHNLAKFSKFTFQFCYTSHIVRDELLNGNEHLCPLHKILDREYEIL
jgi:hypothetical protein